MKLSAGATATKKDAAFLSESILLHCLILLRLSSSTHKLKSRIYIKVYRVMKKLVCEFDSTSHGGKVLSGSDRIKVKGRRVAKIAVLVSCPIHGDNEIVEGSDHMKDAGTPLSRDGDATQCGSVLIASTGGATVR